MESVTPEDLLQRDSGPELYDYAACSELVTGRKGLCDGFPGGPLSTGKAVRRHTVVRADGRLDRETLYGACVSRAAAYRFLALMVEGAPEDLLLEQLRLLLYGEDMPVLDVLRAYVGAYRNGSLEGLPRPDLARIGFFNHVLGKQACLRVKSPDLRQECHEKAAALEALRAKDAGRCLKGDFLCRALVLGPEVCRKLGEPIVRDHCEKGTAPAGAPVHPARPTS